MKRLLGFILRPRSRRRQIRGLALWAIVAVLGIFMIGRGVCAPLQPWGNAWDKLFGIGFVACITGIALYRVIAVAAGLSSPPVEGLVSSAASLLFVVAGFFVVLRKEATIADVIAGTCGILFFGVGAIVLFRRAREDWRRR